MKDFGLLFFRVSLAGKKDMRNCFLTAAAIVSMLTLSCRSGLEDMRGHRKPSAGGVHRTDSSSAGGPQAALDTTIYTFGMEFPESYDWRRDTAYGNVNCRVVLFANQKRILELDAGPGTGLSADADMHRIWDGHLYSDSRSGKETIIFKDGDEIVRYPGNEMICGLMVHSGKVHTLGQDRSGKGFSYRIDGECILSDPEGRVTGDFYSSPLESGTIYLDGDAVCFGYRSGDGQWYAARDGIPQKADTGGIEEVLALRCNGGSVDVCGTSSRYGGKLVLLRDGKVSVLWDREILSAGYCHILPSGGRTFVIEGHQRRDGRTESSLWENGLTRTYGTDYAGFWISGGEYASITLKGGRGIGTIKTPAGYWWFSDEMSLMTHSCVAYRKGVLLIAATPVRKELSPVLWKNGKSLALVINGYLAGISFAQSLEQTVDGL